jgi:curved DNA-binding protein CbpA
VRTLPIGPLEAFVLSRVDGRANDQEIGLVTGLSTPEVSAVLTRLALLGAVAYGSVRAEPLKPSSLGEIARAPSSAPNTRVMPPPAADSGPVHSVPAKAPSHMPAAVAVAPPTNYDPAELDAPGELDPARKRLILDTFYALEGTTHYELLKVAPTADKKAIKSAYFDIVGTFHPDKYFGKNLGAFKPKLEKVFHRITDAHDTLTRPKNREEYDRYLESQNITRALATRDDTRAELDAIFAELEREALLAASERASLTPPPGSVPPVTATATAAPVDPFAATRTQPSRFRGNTPIDALRPPVTDVAIASFDDARPRPPMTLEERRRALARKLGGSMPPPASVQGPVTGSSSASREAAAENLKHRYEARLVQLRADRLKRYIHQADDAVAAKNMVAAANALRIAISLAPDDTTLAARFDDVERLAAGSLADQYLEQARYDERRGYFAEASLAYERVLRGRPSAGTYERAAHCLVESKTDLKKAVDWAKKAVDLAPRDVAYRITLARAYARAEMAQSALAELERARGLAPSDDTIKDWIKRVKRGEV